MSDLILNLWKSSGINTQNRGQKVNGDADGDADSDTDDESWLPLGCHIGVVPVGGCHTGIALIVSYI